MHGAKKTYDGKIAGLYDLEETLGRGHFAVVKLARHVFTGEKVAVKVIDKTKLDEISRAHLFQEVRCMKLVQHPNVVRLYEVIDTQTKLYLILELGDGGDLYDYIMKHEAGLGEDTAKEYFRQIVRAISYCHQLHVVHRDLKPENVVFFERLGIVKLTDFGFSNKFCPGQKLDTSCGSLAYSAPEILLGDSYDAPAVDVWSLGVILYMLVAGQAPFQEANDSETLTRIMDCKYTIPTHVSEACRNLIAKMLVREPEFRATLEDIASDPWLGGSSQIEYLPLVSRHQVTDEDHNIIINKMVNGNIATKEEVLEALDRNEYNHITATYFLLAERRLRTYRQEQAKIKVKDFNNLTGMAIASDNSFEKAHFADSTSSETLEIPSLKYTLNVPRTPGETSQGKVRKCSIVQEEEDEEEYCPVVGSGQELTPPHSSLNRRGSRSEGKLNLVIQERIAEERRKEKKESPRPSPHCTNVPRITAKDDASWLTKRTSPTSINSGVPVSYIPGTVTRKIHLNKPASVHNSTLDSKSLLKGGPVRMDNKNASGDFVSNRCNLVMNSECKNQSAQILNQTVQEVENKAAYSSQESRSSCLPEKDMSGSQQTLDFNAVSLKDAATIAIPIRGVFASGINTEPKYKTMPSSTSFSSEASKTTFENVFESTTAEGECPMLGNRTNRKSITGMYEQRRNKFHKARTTSCSSSDASDDDSESRKKRAHKISMEKNQRRDSHDDFDGRQDRNGNGSSGGNPASSLESGNGGMHNQDQSMKNEENKSSENGDQSGSGNHRQCNGDNFRRSRRRTGETRLRESQSLNRIMEVQESEGTYYSLGNAEVFRERLKKNESETGRKFFPHKSLINWKLISSDKGKSGKSLGARFLQTWSNTISSTKLTVQKRKTSTEEGKVGRDGSTKTSDVAVQLPKNKLEEKEKTALIEKREKKLKVLSRYFQVSKKLCIPIPNLSSSNGRLYKARSCGSISKDKITTMGINSLKLSPNGTIQNKGESGNGKGNGSNIYCSSQTELNFPKKNQSLESTLANGGTNSLRRFQKNNGRHGGKNNFDSSNQPAKKVKEYEGDVNKNLSNAKVGYLCPEVGICQMHMRDAAKCHLS